MADRGTLSHSGYAGDLLPAAAWELLSQARDAQLVDVRTTAEWRLVGLPDLSPLDREPLLIEWQSFPSMAANPHFVAQMKAALAGRNAGPETPVLFLCRTGGRSRAAAIAMSNAGFARAYNIATGFEGDLDAEGHRGHCNGWKASGLPWRQS